MILAIAMTLAAAAPQASVGGLHVQAISYQPDQVVSLRVAPGYALTLEFAADEHIENVVVGDSTAWQVTANRRADHLFLKSSPNAPITNMEVITDARSYSFELSALPAAEPQMAYVVRFLYPAVPPGAETIVSADQAVYKVQGDPALLPLSMTDDGTKTSVDWAPDAAQPAVFKLDASGQERIVNGRVVNGHYVIEGVSARYVFRLGRARAIAARHMLGSRQE